MSLESIKLNEIYVGDALELLPQFKGVDSILTSPPFNFHDMGKVKRTRRVETRDEQVEYLEWYDKFVNGCRATARDYCLIFNNSENMKDIFRRTDPIRTLMWFKPGGRNTYRFNPIFVYEGYNPRFNFTNGCWNDSICEKDTAFGYLPLLQKNKVHPHQDPMKLYVQLLRYLTRRKGAGVTKTILDPCLGSGTTALACRSLGLNWIGIEIDPARATVARSRIVGGL